MDGRPPQFDLSAECLDEDVDLSDLDAPSPEAMFKKDAIAQAMVAQRAAGDWAEPDGDDTADTPHPWTGGKGSPYEDGRRAPACIPLDSHEAIDAAMGKGSAFGLRMHDALDFCKSLPPPRVFEITPPDLESDPFPYTPDETSPALDVPLGDPIDNILETVGILSQPSYPLGPEWFLASEPIRRHLAKVGPTSLMRLEELFERHIPIAIENLLEALRGARMARHVSNDPKRPGPWRLTPYGLQSLGWAGPPKPAEIDACAYAREIIRACSTHYRVEVSDILRGPPEGPGATARARFCAALDGLGWQPDRIASHFGIDRSWVINGIERWKRVGGKVVA